MATITYSAVKADENIWRSWLVTWANMGNADTGTVWKNPGFADKSVQVTGTFGAATVVIEGSNDNTNWFTLRDPQGTSLSFTSAGLKQILENTLYIRASTSGGTGTAVNVAMLASSFQRQG